MDGVFVAVEQVRVAVHCDRCAGVSEPSRDTHGVDASVDEIRCVAVAEVVVAESVEADFAGCWNPDALPPVRVADWSASLGGESQIGVALHPRQCPRRRRRGRVRWQFPVVAALLSSWLSFPVSRRHFYADPSGAGARELAETGSACRRLAGQLLSGGATQVRGRAAARVSLGPRGGPAIVSLASRGTTGG